jgi:hypothetical protein
VIRWRRVLKVAGLTALAALVVQSLPDVARYLRIREM